ncbi:MAG TPA: hypothetical protein VHC00_06950 [Rhizobiaceae bacterium]|jgi:hypothetical protein|nr:hypothetical protein [Rhizobiaceae bacterium]
MSQDHTKQETIHDEIEAEISSQNIVAKRSVWRGLGWKIAALIILAGVVVWVARAHHDSGPIHAATASAR